jgi:tetracycline 7-halogenase / FADH2 O2-dependent halogenase
VSRTLPSPNPSSDPSNQLSVYPSNYPSGDLQRDRWILDQRPPHEILDPQKPHAFFVEDEAAASNEGAAPAKVVPVTTIVLTNRECPWRCVMCDLWRNTLTTSVPLGAIPAQIDFALSQLSAAPVLNLGASPAVVAGGSFAQQHAQTNPILDSPSWISQPPISRALKLYNSGSFFDARAIPVEDHQAIADRANNFDRLIVENHPALTDDKILRFRDRLRCRLEIAMGLETVHPEILPRLNKRMTLEQFSSAADFLRAHDIDLRVFILVQPPFMKPSEALHWAERSLDFAFDCGATAATFIPTRGGNGAMEALAANGEFSPPNIGTLEAAMTYGLSLKRGRVFVDLWDADKLPGCKACLPRQACLSSRTSRLRQINLSQIDQASQHRAICDATPIPGPMPSAHSGADQLKDTYDIAIVGSGFGGSLLAMIAHQLGRSVILLEKGKHPRFAIGESSTPLSNILLEQLTTRYRLPNLMPLSKWGSWQKTNPQVAGGLKRGFTFYHHTLGAPSAPDPEHQRQLLVAASPHDGIADTHWCRADVDHFFVEQAQQIGVPYLDEVNLQGVTESDSEIRVTGHRGNKEFSVGAKFLVDATGPRGFLHRALQIRELELPDFPATQAFFSHFTGVDQIADGVLRDSSDKPPYPVDDAAVHHVFEGGWIWVLKFNNGITSAGVAATDQLAERLRLSEGEAAWHRLLDLLPAVKEQFATAQANRPFTHMPRVAFRSKHIAGRRWAMLPSAAGFVDPLLSTGFPLTLLGVLRLAEMIEQDWDTPRFPGRLNTYATQTGSELVDTGHLIASLYATMDRFPLFVSLSLLYFAAASFSEAARRLGKPHLARSFLLGDNRDFWAAALRCFERARTSFSEGEMRDVSQEVLLAIEPVNIAGLGNPARQNWYPVDADDLLNAAGKLESTKEEITQMLEKCGFWK